MGGSSIAIFEIDGVLLGGHKRALMAARMALSNPSARFYCVSSRDPSRAPETLRWLAANTRISVAPTHSATFCVGAEGAKPFIAISILLANPNAERVVVYESNRLTAEDYAERLTRLGKPRRWTVYHVKPNAIDVVGSSGITARSNE